MCNGNKYIPKQTKKKKQMMMMIIIIIINRIVDNLVVK